jgi:hypothetical protein
MAIGKRRKLNIRFDARPTIFDSEGSDIVRSEPEQWIQNAAVTKIRPIKIGGDLGVDHTVAHDDAQNRHKGC